VLLYFGAIEEEDQRPEGYVGSGQQQDFKIRKQRFLFVIIGILLLGES
jgi:hypothetical protein